MKSEEEIRASLDACLKTIETHKSDTLYGHRNGKLMWQTKMNCLAVQREVLLWVLDEERKVQPHEKV
jgi:hypothetical protein